jgi:hypothetical protein
MGSRLDVLDRLKMTYLAAEDRLELCIFARAPAKVHRLHLTRRLTRQWLDQLAQVVEVSAQVPAGANPSTRAAIAAMHHEAVAAKANFNPGSADAELEAQARTVPPALVTQVNCGYLRQEGRWVLRFGLGATDSVSLTLSTETLHGTVELLSRQLAATDWQLSPPVSPSAPSRVVDGVLH